MPSKTELVADLGWATSPAHMVFDRRQHLFVACDLTSSVIELDVRGIVVRRHEIAPGRQFALEALLAGSDGSVWVASHKPSRLHRISPTVDGSVRSYRLASGSDPSALVENRGEVFAANAGAGTISKIDRDGFLTEVFARLPRGAQPVGISIDSAGNLYTADWQTGAIARISPDGRVDPEFALLPAPNAAFSLTREHSGALFIVASGGVFSLDLTSGALEQVVALPPTPFHPFSLADHPEGFTVTGGGSVVLRIQALTPSHSGALEFGHQLRLMSCANSARGDLFVGDYSSGRIFRAEP